MVKTPPNSSSSFLKKLPNKVIELLSFSLLYFPSFFKLPNRPLKILCFLGCLWVQQLLYGLFVLSVSLLLCSSNFNEEDDTNMSFVLCTISFSEADDTMLICVRCDLFVIDNAYDLWVVKYFVRLGCVLPRTALHSLDDDDDAHLWLWVVKVQPRK